LNSINELETWQKDALILWVFDMEEEVYLNKAKRTEELFKEIPQETEKKE
jgi:hypothetical protein